MGTRSLTKIYNGPLEEENEICTMYRQYDGYLEGHGQELVKFLKDFIIVNGFGKTDNKKIANGMNCLSAQIIAFFKKETGGIYLERTGANDMGEEYIYHIFRTDNELYMKVEKTNPDYNKDTQIMGISNWVSYFNDYAKN